MGQSTEMKVIDANKTALVVIDLQKGIVYEGNRAPYTGAQVVENASKLAQTFSEKAHSLCF